MVVGAAIQRADRLQRLGLAAHLALPAEDRIGLLIVAQRIRDVHLRRVDPAPCQQGIAMQHRIRRQPRRHAHRMFDQRTGAIDVVQSQQRLAPQPLRRRLHHRALRCGRGARGHPFGLACTGHGLMRIDEHRRTGVCDQRIEPIAGLDRRRGRRQRQGKGSEHHAARPRRGPVRGHVSAAAPASHRRRRAAAVGRGDEVRRPYIGPVRRAAPAG